MKRLFTAAILISIFSAIYAKPVKTIPLKSNKTDVMDYYMDQGFSVSKTDNNRFMVDTEEATFNGLPISCIILDFDNDDKLKIFTAIFTDYTYKSMYETILMVTMAFECKIQSMRLDPRFSMITYSDKEKCNYIWSYYKNDYLEGYNLNIVEK